MSQPFTIEDLYLHQTIDKLHCVAGLDRAICVVKSIDRQGDSYVTHLWEYALDGNGGKQMTDGPGSETSPRWSPGGERLAFLSDRSGGPSQIHVMPREGGEAHQVGSFPQSVTSLRWTPDGRGLIVTAAVKVDPDLRGRPSSEPPPGRKASAPEIAWRLPYKEDGIGYLLQRQIHLFAVDVQTSEQRRLTDGAFDVLGFDVSEDGKRVAYTRSREGRYAHCYDLWISELASGEHRRLTFEHAMVMQPVWSPDGRHIAFSGAVTEADAQPRLWVADSASGKVEELGGDEVDVAEPESLYWAPDGRSIFFTRAHRGRHQIASLSFPEGKLTVLVSGDRQFGAFGCAEGRLVYSNEHPTLPSELWSCDMRGEGEVQLSQLNPWWSERWRICAEARSFDVPDGKGGTETIEGWLLRAEGAKGPMPLLNDAHGGPAAYALLDYDTNVFWQALCAQGWAVLALNAVGSASYGREFCERLAGHWGEYDLPQHLEAIRQLQAEGVCDDRVAISGKSYGGYLSSWATGHTDVFRAAVVMAPVGNIETHYGTSDGGYYADPLYVASKPRFDREVARRLSPLQYIERSTTPTLFMQGKEDERCPKCQSEELFVSLYRAGETETELVLYPGETHGFLGEGTPSCREDAARRIMQWVQRFTHAAPPEVEPGRAHEEDAVAAV